MALNQSELALLDSLKKVRDGHAPNHSPNIVDLRKIGFADVQQVPGGVNRTVLTSDGHIRLAQLLQKKTDPNN